jgi:hypothetical protein
MYVAPTPFALTSGTTGQITLIAPGELTFDGRLEQVGELVRVETDQMVIGYMFDLRANDLTAELAPNPSAGKEHHFGAYRLKGMGSGVVSMRAAEDVARQLPPGDDE